MIDDLNKTTLTCKVTTDVALWLDGHGFKPVETEVPMPWIDVNQTGWIADIAAVIHPTQTELIELKMLPKKPSYRSRSAASRATGEFEYLMGMEDDAHRLWQEQLSSLRRFMTCLVEVKTTRADFRGDRKWLAAAPTDIRYLALPKALLKETEWPQGWGILEWSDGAVKQLRAPEAGNSSIEHHLAVTLAIAIRRDHHTRYARLREERHGRRDSDREQRTQRIHTSVRKLARAVIGIAKGERESVEMNLSLAGVFDAPDWMVEQLRELWGVAAGVKA